MASDINRHNYKKVTEVKEPEIPVFRTAFELFCEELQIQQRQLKQHREAFGE